MAIDQISGAGSVQPVASQVSAQQPAVGNTAQGSGSPIASSASDRNEAQKVLESLSKPEQQKLVQGAVDTTNRFVQSTLSNSNLQFSLDHDTSKIVVKLVDSGTKEVIKQIPSEEMLAIAKALDKLQGLLIRDQA